MAAENSERGKSAADGENGAPYQHELAIKIDELDLSVRARNILMNARIEYVGDLVQMTEDRLLRFPNCGRKTVRELRERLAELGFDFSREPTLSDWFPSSVTSPDGTTLPHPGQNARTKLPSSVTSPDRTTLAYLDENTRTKLYLRVDELGLSQRAKHVLKGADIELVGDLVRKTEIELRKLSSCGRQTIAEIRNKLRKLDLHLGVRISDWDSAAAREIRQQHDADSESPIAALRRGLNPIPPSEFLEDELRAILASVASERDTDLALKQLGWSGDGQRTLDSVGQEYSITRERVRQIVTRTTDKIRNAYFETPRLDHALSILRDRCPATATELAAELRVRGVSNTDFDPTGLEIACDILQREFGLKRIPLRDAKVYVAAEYAKRIVEFFRLCRRLTSSHGCVNFDAACDELHIPEPQRPRFRDLATIESMCEWLDPERRWLFSTDVSRNRLSNLVAKVLSVAPHVYLAELRKAVARSRRLAVVPPVGVLASFVERFKLASVSNRRASAMSPFADAIAPGSAESVLLSVLRTHGPILRWDRFQELCVAAGMNPVTFGIYASGSPIIARVTRGIYSLVSADVPPGAVEELEREAVASRKPAEWGWTPRGTLWYALPITETVLAAGSVPVAQFVASIADGDWKACFDGRQLDGSVRCGNRFLWGLRRPLINAGAEPGDVAILELDLSKRTVNITLGGEELADMWESGDIDLPPPEIGEAEVEDRIRGRSPES